MVAELRPTALGLTAGILWGLAVLVTGLTAALFGYGLKFVDVVGSFYLGYEPTVIGSILGGVWGFFDGLIGGFVFALLYNYLAKKLTK
ncbi:bacteriophage holin [Methanocella arvoryzae]|uniref:Membrane-associated protein n=1 Tax=Methanocella arvoryzae (strain DSM 22066 / NBRC 105507 / MRE50) TaxID=351160 RepID=Q0W1K4_METAR|nr:bacteriophage holin [Methanocella arvoryzae]CAJ37739.1 conserved hypothetical protein [Methanocella arvoryzae MRE50]